MMISGIHIKIWVIFFVTWFGLFLFIGWLIRDADAEGIKSFIPVLAGGWLADKLASSLAGIKR